MQRAEAALCSLTHHLLTGGLLPSMQDPLCGGEAPMAPPYPSLSLSRSPSRTRGAGSITRGRGRPWPRAPAGRQETVQGS